MEVVQKLKFPNNSIIKINPNKYDGDEIPIIRLINHFLNKINESNEIKLTKAGNLPPNLVKELYNQKFLFDYVIELGITKLTKETDVEFIVFIKIICEISGLIKKRNNNISLTKKTKEYENNLLKIILSNSFYKYNWSCFDAFENTMIGQFGNNYTLYLLNKYGHEWKDKYFYPKLYFKAFPDLLDKNDKDTCYFCYYVRTFQRMLYYFGFIEFKDKKLHDGEIRATELFRKYIKI